MRMGEKMLFDSFEMKQKKNELRDSAVKRKLQETSFENYSFHLELDVLESFERLYQRNTNTPYFELKYSEDPTASKKTHTAYSPFDSKTSISIHKKDVDRIKWFSEECFAAPISTGKADYYKRKGCEIRKFDYQLYEEKLFSIFSVCKNDISDYVFCKAVELMALHEFAHAANNHAKLRYDREDLCPEVLRGLEIQADISSAIYFSHSLMEDEKFIGILNKYPTCQKDRLVVNTYFNSIVIATLSAYVSFRCTLRNNYYWIEESDFSLDGGDSHPITEARMRIVIDTIIKCICSELDEEESMYLTWFLSIVIEEFDSFYCKNTTKNNDYSVNRKPLKLMETVEGEAYLKKLRESAEMADDYLEPYERFRFYDNEAWHNYL